MAEIINFPTPQNVSAAGHYISENGRRGRANLSVVEWKQLRETEKLRLRDSAYPLLAEVPISTKILRRLNKVDVYTIEGYKDLVLLGGRVPLIGPVRSARLAATISDFEVLELPTAFNRQLRARRILMRFH